MSLVQSSGFNALCVTTPFEPLVFEALFLLLQKILPSLQTLIEARRSRADMAVFKSLLHPASSNGRQKSIQVCKAALSTPLRYSSIEKLPMKILPLCPVLPLRDQSEFLRAMSAQTLRFQKPQGSRASYA